MINGVSSDSHQPQYTSVLLHLVSDDELLARTCELARHETEITILTLHHLNEIQRRMLHRKRGYPSLFEYAVRELHYSKGCAWRRIMVMKLCRDVPGIEAKLRSGELNLTTVSQLQNAIEKRARKATQARVSEVVTAPPIGAGIAVHGAAETGVAPGDSPAAVPGPDRAVATEFAARETVPGLTGAGPLLLATGVAPAEAAVAATESAPQSPPEADAARGAEPATPAADPRAAWTAGQKAELVELVAGKSARETEKLLAELEPDLGLPRERERALGGGRYEVRVILDQTSVESDRKAEGLAVPREPWLQHRPTARLPAAAGRAEARSDPRAGACGAQVGGDRREGQVPGAEVGSHRRRGRRWFTAEPGNRDENAAPVTSPDSSASGRGRVRRGVERRQRTGQLGLTGARCLSRDSDSPLAGGEYAGVGTGACPAPAAWRRHCRFGAEPEGAAGTWPERRAGSAWQHWFGAEPEGAARSGSQPRAAAARHRRFGAEPGGAAGREQPFPLGGSAGVHGRGPQADAHSGGGAARGVAALRCGLLLPGFAHRRDLRLYAPAADRSHRPVGAGWE